MPTTPNFRKHIELKPWHSIGLCGRCEYAAQCYSHTQYNRLHAKYVAGILKEATARLKRLPNLNQASTAISKQVTICGDLHGKLDDLLVVFHKVSSVRAFTFPAEPSTICMDYVNVYVCVWVCVGAVCAMYIFAHWLHLSTRMAVHEMDNTHVHII